VNAPERIASAVRAAAQVLGQFVDFVIDFGIGVLRAIFGPLLASLKNARLNIGVSILDAIWVALLRIGAGQDSTAISAEFARGLQAALMTAVFPAALLVAIGFAAAVVLLMPFSWAIALVAAAVVLAIAVTLLSEAPGPIGFTPLATTSTSQPDDIVGASMSFLGIDWTPELRRAFVSILVGGIGMVLGTVGLRDTLGVAALTLAVVSLLISWATVGAVAYFLTSYQVEWATIISVGTGIASAVLGIPSLFTPMWPLGLIAMALGVVATLVSLNVLLPVRLDLPARLG